MYPTQAPWTGIGSLQSDIREVKRELHQKVDRYSLDAISSRVDRMECALRELRSEIDGLVYRVQQLEADKIECQ